jgi:hypothetical protein
MKIKMVLILLAVFTTPVPSQVKNIICSKHVRDSSDLIININHNFSRFRHRIEMVDTIKCINISFDNKVYIYYAADHYTWPFEVNLIYKNSNHYYKRKITVNLTDSELDYDNIFHIEDYNNVNFSILQMVEKLISATDTSINIKKMDKKVAILTINDHLFRVKVKYEERASCGEAVLSSDYIFTSDFNIGYEWDDIIDLNCGNKLKDFR